MARYAAAVRNSALDDIAPNLNSGYLRIYSGTRPTDADTALSGNTLLAELTFSATAFAAASGGSAVANAIGSEDSALATGTATFARLFASNGTTAVVDASVGVGTGEIQLPTLDISAGVEVSCSACSLVFGVGA